MNSIASVFVIITSQPNHVDLLVQFFSSHQKPIWRDSSRRDSSWRDLIQLTLKFYAHIFQLQKILAPIVVGYSVASRVLFISVWCHINVLLLDKSVVPLKDNWKLLYQVICGQFFLMVTIVFIPMPSSLLFPNHHIRTKLRHSILSREIFQSLYTHLSMLTVVWS